MGARYPLSLAASGGRGDRGERPRERGGSRLRVGIGHGVAALEENEGEMETDGSRARVRCWGRLGRLGRPGRPMPWWVLLLLGCSASFISFFLFLQTENKKENQRGIWEDLERCDKILKVLNLRSIQ